MVIVCLVAACTGLVNVVDSGAEDGDSTIAIGETGLTMSLVSTMDTFVGAARALVNLGMNAASESGVIGGDMAWASAGRVLRMLMGLVVTCLGRLVRRRLVLLLRLRLLLRRLLGGSGVPRCVRRVVLVLIVLVCLARRSYRRMVRNRCLRRRLLFARLSLGLMLLC